MEEIAGYGEMTPEQEKQLEELRRERRRRFGIPESSPETSPNDSSEE